MPSRRSGLLRAFAVTGLGITLALVPPMLWVAWTPALFIIVLAVGSVSAALLIFLLGREPTSAEASRHPMGSGSRNAVSDEFVEEVHRLFPLTYHHSRIASTRFRRAMEKLRHLVR